MGRHTAGAGVGVAAAIVNGSVAAEASAEDTVDVTVTHEGVVVAVGGSADVTIDG